MTSGIGTPRTRERVITLDSRPAALYPRVPLHPLFTSPDTRPPHPRSQPQPLSMPDDLTYSAVATDEPAADSGDLTPLHPLTDEEFAALLTITEADLPTREPFVPFASALSTLAPLSDESVTFLLCMFGRGLVLGFKGDHRSVERCYNWAANTGVTKGALMWVYGSKGGGDRGGLGYVFCESRDDLREGLIAQFRAEAIVRGEVLRTREEWSLDDDGDEVDVLITYDEDHLHSLAAARADRFLADKIVHESFLLGRPRGVADIHSMYLPRRQHSSSDGDSE